MSLDNHHGTQPVFPAISAATPKFSEMLNERFTRISNGSSYGMWDWDFSDGCVYLYGGFWDKLSIYEDGHAGMLASEKIADRFFPDDWKVMESSMSALTQESPLLSLQARFRCRDGNYLWTQVEGRATFDDAGAVKYLSGMAFEITQLKNTETLLRQSEERHERILTATSDGIWEWTAESGGFHFSSRCWEHLGYTKLDDEMLEGRNRLEAWRERIHADDVTEFDRQMQQHLKNKGPFDVEYRIAGKDGAWRWIRARGQASYNEKGFAVRMSGTNMDITKLKDAEERVIKAKEAAEKANLAKSEFLSSMSHELRTPLNAIQGYAQLFQIDMTLSEMHRDNAMEIDRAGQHLLQLINDVLDLSKIESGKMTMSVEPVMPMRTVRECIKLIQPMVESREVRLWVVTDGLENASVSADATRLKQALLNLLSNAIKYNRRGGDVEVVFSLLDNNRFRIEVKDSGQGIPEARKSEVFEPFNRLGAEGSSIEGSGVGLVITKRLVNMMGGTLSFWSQEGVGSRFWVDLPCIESVTSVDVPETSDCFDLSENMRSLKYTKRVLYVEDNPSNIRLMENVFKGFPQLEILTAKEAFYGVFLARTEQPDLIILDINLPGMDGYEALTVLKQDTSTQKIPVIALTANAMSYDIARGKAAGFDEYLTKPLEIEKLLQAFDRFLVVPED